MTNSLNPFDRFEAAEDAVEAAEKEASVAREDVVALLGAYGFDRRMPEGARLLLQLHRRWSSDARGAVSVDGRPLGAIVVGEIPHTGVVCAVRAGGANPHTGERVEPEAHFLRVSLREGER